MYLAAYINLAVVASLCTAKVEVHSSTTNHYSAVNTNTYSIIKNN